MLKALLIALALIAGLAWNPQKIYTTYDSQKNLTTVRLAPQKLSGEKDRYHSITVSIDYSYSGKTPAPPERVNFEVISVVKARRLNPDLYVVFVVDGKPIHFSSNRSAIRNPAPGRPWTGERMAFLIPREEFLKIAAAEKLAIKMGGVTFEFNDELRDVVRSFGEGIAR
jgi:hypothetical protein